MTEPDRTVTVTIEADLSGFYRVSREHSARAMGWHDLADVIERQEGAQIVRDGMGDVLHWLKECACYDRTDERVWRDYKHQRVQAAREATAAAWSRFAESLAAIGSGFTRFFEALGGAPGPRPGSDARRSPYGPQERRR